MENMTNPHLQVCGINKSFGNVRALLDVDFSVRRGEVMALVGDNGAGKSTLMKVLAGAYSYDSGDFLIDGKNVTINSPTDAANQGIQIVYQDLALCDNLDVIDNLSLGHEPTKGGIYKLLPKSLRPLDMLKMTQKAHAAIEKLKVKTLRSTSLEVGVLSGGQKQAIAIARAVSSDSSVVLLDEPTAALGVSQTAQVLDIVSTLKKSGHSVVYISHNLKDIFQVADRITVMRLGEQIAIYETAKITPQELVVAMTSGVETDSQDKKDLADAC
ncbi:ATP-binding cassette domain-containing protein [Marinomonas flavescens]|uniref:ATP-binding cassette domain-containing protein n=1 Tax=Marinomonas flavescens TaxID=2529379 RepID=UPI001A9E52E1|nr:ATP-binding cassette domain-containing protein [Marinomonas flavescens]